MSNRLPILAEEIADAHKAVGLHLQSASERALEAGTKLNEAKALCQHGTWATWLHETGIPERTAQRYMRLARAGYTSATVADLGFAACERYAAAAERLPAIDEGSAVCFAGRNPEIGAEFLAYAWPAASGTYHYVSYQIIDGEGFEIVPRGPLPAWLVGMFHTDRMGREEVETMTMVPVREATDFIERLRSAA